MKNKKITVAAGGTGGHLFPAKKLIHDLKGSVEVEIAGAFLNENNFLDLQNISINSITSSHLPLRRPWRWPIAAYRITQGILQARRYLQASKPELVVGFGSYHTLPILLAAKSLKIPFLLQESNVMPGKVNRFFSSSALVTAISFPAAAKHLKGSTQAISHPLHFAEKTERLKALDYYGFDSTKPVLLVFGGSQGAQAINTTIPKKALGNLQILHLTGSDKETQPVQSNYEKKGIMAVVKPFETQMQYAWGCADFAIARAGAGTIFEALHYEVPLLAIPYPYAADQHQDYNAHFLEDQIQGGFLLKQEAFSTILFDQKFSNMLENRTSIIKNIRNYKNKYHAPNFAELVINTLE